MKHEKEIQTIAAHYGADEQIIQTVEEISELAIELLNIRKHGDNLHNRACVAEEIADVEIMLDQIKYLYQIENRVDGDRTRKIERQLKRISEERKMDV